MRVSRVTTLSLLALFAAGLAFAQTTGSIEGTIVDETGTVLPGVTVEATSPSLQGTKVAVADGEGRFRLVLLPPGTYAVKFTLEGFAATDQSDVAVGLGRIVTLHVAMRSAFKDEVVVTGSTPTIDVKSTEVGVNIEQEFFRNIPTGRNYTSVAQVAPGVVSTSSDDCPGCVSVYGSSGGENAYYLDGVNTTGVELGIQGKVLNFEFIQEVQVKTGGYLAEYGRATGGLINVITKSGGNDYHGDVFGYYDSPDTQTELSGDVVQGADEGGVDSLVSSHDRQDFGADLGGYLVRDRLWFFGAYNYVRDTEDHEIFQDFMEYGGTNYNFPVVGDVFAREVSRDLWAAKLTWRPAQNHSLIASGFGDPTTLDGPGPGQPLSSEPTVFMQNIESGGTDVTLKYEGVIGSSLVIDAQAASHTEKTIVDGPGFDIPRFYDRTHPLYLEAGTLVQAGGFGYAQRAEFGREIVRGNAAYFAKDLLGDHEFKGGLEAEHLTVDNENYNSGGQRIYKFVRDGVTYYRHRFYTNDVPGDANNPTEVDNSWIQNPNIVNSKADNVAAYVQDTWRIAPTLTLNLGLRWEQQELYDNAGAVSAKIDDNWAPRLGFVWDFAGDGSSKVFGSWGYFHESIPLDIVIRSFGGENTAFIYNFHGALDDPDRTTVQCDPNTPRGCGNVTVGANTPVDPDLKGQYIEEFVVGADVEVARDFALGAKYVWRDLGRVIEDGLNADLNYLIGNPGEGTFTTTYDYDCSCYPFPVNKPKRTFEGVELTARKRFSDNWQMVASYLWSKLEGNYDGTFQASTGQLDPNINSAFDYAEFQVNNSGFLTADRRHQFKIDGYYAFPFGLSVGASAYYRTGLPVTAYGYTFGYENWELYLSERGAFGRTDDEYEADLHLGYPIRLGGVEVNLMADVFNLLDRQGETNRNMYYTLVEDYQVIDYDTGEALGPIRPGDTDRPPTNPAFNKANAWQDPRSVRLGVRITF